MGRRLFVDMDGTLSVFVPQSDMGALYQKGYFSSLVPQENVLDAVRILIEQKAFEVFILSAYLYDSPFALQEKNAWIDRYLPEIKVKNRLFVECGRDKKNAVIGGVGSEDFLLDDFTKNLVNWNPGSGIKLLNGINHTKGSWMGAKVRYDSLPDELAKEIAEIMERGS